MNAEQLGALVATIITFVLTIPLAASMTRKYLRTKARSQLFWSLGLWAFAIGVLLELVFAAGVYGEFLIALYLFIVALLVELLALGSMELIKQVRLRQVYYVFCIASTVLLLYSLAVSNIGNLMVGYIVEGNPPLFAIYTSSLITFVASTVLIVVGLYSYLKTKNPRLLSIVVGVIVVVLAGTLYVVVPYPEFLYYSEFIGIACLWYGFGSAKPSK